MFFPTAPVHRASALAAVPARELRKMIPTVALLRTMTQVALCGVYPRLDATTGEEIGPAVPVPIPESVAAAKYLIDKALPPLKGEDDSTDAGYDRNRLKDLTKDDIKRMTKAEVEAALEASFTLETDGAGDDQSPTHEPPQPSTSAAESARDVRKGEVERPSPD